MSWRTGSAAAALALAASAPAAPAQQNVQGDPTVVGKFYAPDGHSVLYVVTTKPIKGKVSKVALVGVEFENTGEDYRFNGTYSHLDAAFLNADDWRKFVAIWRRTRSAHEETKDDRYYFDGQTELGVGLTGRGEVSFTLGGNGHDEHNVPKSITSFFLPPKDIPEFDRDVRQVSAYFAK